MVATEFTVVAQCRDDITVKSYSDCITLYCISSKHEESSYTWKMLSKPNLAFPNTPVLYVKGDGLYQCTVSRGTGRMFVTSEVISIDVQPGTIYKLADIIMHVLD